jgi:uncharacterized protein (DUF1778 family)
MTNSKLKKPDKDKLTERIELRVSPYEKARLQGFADLYARGNLSLFLVYTALNVNRKFLEENDLLSSNRRIDKRKGFRPSCKY